LPFLYTLEHYSGRNSRFKCPDCGRNFTFSRYINTETQEYLANHVGRCNRRDNCGYHYTPKQYFQDNNISLKNSCWNPLIIPEPRRTISSLPPSNIPDVLFNQSLKSYDKNNFVIYLIKQFGEKLAEESIHRYHIGTSKYWDGATVFWQRDISGNIRTGKIMLYDPFTGKRVKQPSNYITWAHKVLKLPGFNLQQCFFGEHILSLYDLPVVVVEAAKTATIASIFFKKYIWLSCEGKEGLTAEKCQVLKGRKVIFYPDLGAFEAWNKKAKELSHIANFSVSDLLERNATEKQRQQGWDLADYLLQIKDMKSGLSLDSID